MGHITDVRIVVTGSVPKPFQIYKTSFAQGATAPELPVQAHKTRGFHNKSIITRFIDSTIKIKSGFDKWQVMPSRM